MRRALFLWLALWFVLTGRLVAEEKEEKDMWAPRPTWGAPAVTAGEESEPEPDPDQTRWVRGSVVEVFSRVLVVEYYDYKLGGKTRMRVTVDKKTVFNGVPGMASIKPGMFTAIDYQVNKAGVAVAETVAVNTEGGPDWGIEQ